MPTEFEKQVSDLAYNVGFGAKKHFATHDIADKMPGIVGFLSLAVGIFGLVHDPLSTKFVSAWLTIAGISAVYASFYEPEPYGRVGTRLTELFNQLRRIRQDKSGRPQEDLRAQMLEIEEEYYRISMPRQMIFSGWFAHFKFFYEMKIEWLNEDLKFRFWRDKMPASATLTLALLLLGLAGYFALQRFNS